jgi:predicted dehydrogenase
MRRARLRVGVIGCGLVAQVMHLPYLRELDDRFEIAALCDLSAPLVDRVGSAYGVDRRYHDWQDLIDAPIDAVMVLTSGSHAPAAIAAAERGRHVFVEKPMCLSAAEGLTMVAAAEARGTHLQVGYMKRYDPAYERLGEELETLRGDLRLVRATTLESPIEPYVAHYPLVKPPALSPELVARLRAEDEQRVDRALGTRVSPAARHAYRWVLLDSLVHELNLLRGLLGEPDSLDFAQVREHGVTAVLVFGGVQCILTWVDLPGMARYEQEFAFYAPERRVTLSFPSPFLRSAPTRLILEGGELGTARSWRTVETASYEEAFKRELVEFAECIAAGRAARTSGRDGLHDVALCEAIVASHEARRPRPRPSEVAVSAQASGDTSQA